jgi:prephenate dehydratase
MSEEDAPLNVAYLGPEASFSHQAAIEVFGAESKASEVALHPLPSFSAIFSSMQHSPAAGESQYDYAVIPIENSTNGAVVQVLDLLAQCGLDSAASYPDLEVCAEHYLPVHHCLFAASRSSSLSAVKTLYTHPQVWGQCGRFLGRHFPPPTTEKIDVGSTSAAAALVAQTGAADTAAIASKLAGHKHSLVCLAENIEDEPGSNTTRFFVVQNRNRRRPMFNNVFGHAKSLITFTIPHARPGSLADALAVFKEYSFNLTSIDTRPGRRRNWQYVFFVECEETRTTTANTDDSDRADRAQENLTNMLADLATFTESLRHLGRFADRLQKDGIETKS